MKIFDLVNSDARSEGTGTLEEPVEVCYFSLLLSFIHGLKIEFFQVTIKVTINNMKVTCSC